MVRVKQLATTALTALLPFPAVASSADGLLTIFVGLPTLLVLLAGLVIALRLRPGKGFKSAFLSIISLPLAYLAYLSSDALRLLRDYPHGSWQMALLFFALLALVLCLVVQLVRQAIRTPIRPKIGL